MGYLYIHSLNVKTKESCSGTSYTNWVNFLELVDRWKNESNLKVGKYSESLPVEVTASFVDGTVRTASYAPHNGEIDKFQDRLSKYINFQ